MKKIIFFTSLCSFFFSEFVVAQRIGPGKPIVESPYYDAIVLYYALKNINAFPLPSSLTKVGNLSLGTSGNPDMPPSTSTGVPMGENTAFGNSSPTNTTGQPAATSTAAPTGATPPTIGETYTIIESSTGKVLLDGFTGKLEDIMQTFPFEAGEQKPFITALLARNGSLTDTSDSAIVAYYQKNKYLYPLIETLYAARFNNENIVLKAPASLNIYSGFSSIASKIGGGGPSFTNLAINAYTDYIIDAVNAEIDDAFFIHLQQALAKDSELVILFPNVLDGLNKIEVTKYTQSINLLKSAYQQDIRNLLSNVGKLATLQRYKNMINKYPWLTLVFVACDLIDYIKKGNIPADILYQINASAYIQGTNPNDFSSVVKLAALISYCLRDIKIGDENTNNKGWINQGQLNLFLKNGDFFQIFTGLMAANANHIQFKNGFDFQTALYDSMPGIMRTHYIVYNFSTTVDHIKTYIQQSTAALDKNNPTAISSFSGFYINIASEILGLAGNCLAVLPGNTAAPAIKEIKHFQDKYFTILYQANKVAAKIEAREYNAAVYETDTLLQQIFVGDNDNDSLYKTRVEKYKKFEDTYIKYGSFIATIASSQSEEDMKNAIKSFALPTGSSRIKKEHYFSVGLNSYVGFTHSWNKLYPPLNIPSQENWFTVPLGISFNYGLDKFGSISLFGGIIDVGAIFTYKINSDSAVQATITFAQIFSPSIGLVYGLPIIKKYNIPLSVGANFQWGPTLQKVDQTGNSVLPLMTRRFNVFIAVDIPLVNFYVSRQY